MEDEARTARRYLLGEMSDEERGALEDRYFREAKLADEIGAAEDDLIDGYVRGELPAPEREALERVLRDAPGMRERVANARALKNVVRVAEVRNRRHRPAALYVAAAAAAIFVSAALLFWQGQRQKSGPQARPAVPVATRTSTTSTDTPVLPPPPRLDPGQVVRSVATLVLAGPSARAVDESPRLVIGSQDTDARIVLNVESGDDQFPAYRLTVQTPSGEVIVQEDVRLQRAGAASTATIELPVSQLKSGADYETLLEAKSGGTYSLISSSTFRVARR